MKKSLIIVLVMVLTGFFCNFISAAEAEKKKQPMTFKEFVTHLDLTKNTSLHVEHFWVKNKGQLFTWTGKVVDVKGGRGKAEIRAANADALLYKGFNLILVTHQKADAAALKVGQQIKFRGQVYNYKGRRGNPVIVYMNNVELLPLAEKK